MDERRWLKTFVECGPINFEEQPVEPKRNYSQNVVDERQNFGKNYPTFVDKDKNLEAIESAGSPGEICSENSDREEPPELPSLQIN